MTKTTTRLKEALYYEKKDDKKVRCTLCPHLCFIPEGGMGLCRARSNHHGKAYAESYGSLTSIALDPIEKKPLRHFSPGSKILSVGSYGCNLKCPFCQNFSISMASSDTVSSVYFEPKQLVEKAITLIPQGNIGLAYTYNEPIISFEYVLDCAKLAHKNKLKNVLVTNGFVNPKPLEELLPYIDAMNIDLKSFSEGFYKKIGGGLGPVQATIKTAAKACHIELTTLIIPGENDSLSEIDESASWIASLSPEIPLHLSRFFPNYKMTQRQATPVEELQALAATARQHLNYVYVGNI